MDVVTVRMHGHYIGDPQVYRSKEEQAEARERDPIELLRAKIELVDDDFEALDAEVHEVVDAALAFAKAGTDPKPEDALRNVYA
jgi:TPP-dependent pyruvate/acetoin dehydrogenase alpha subunit